MLIRLFCCVCLFFGLNFLPAQISITSSDMPQPGDSPRFSIADTLLNIDPSPTGANFNWDFSNLDPIFQRSENYVSRGDVPFRVRLFFPVSTTVVQQLDAPDSVGGFAISDGYQFFRATSSAYEGLGVGGTLNGIPLGLTNDPTDRIYKLPLTFGDRDNGASSAELDFSLLGLYFAQERERTSEVDGYGTLTTPYGQFDVIRVRQTVQGSDTISLDSLNFRLPSPTEIIYSWLGKNQGVPLMQVFANEVNGNEFVTRVEYRDSLRRDVITLDVEDQVAYEKAAVYPNPNQGSFKLKLGKQISPNSELSVIDLNGRIVWKQQFTSESVEISLPPLTPGVYMLELRDRETVYHGKLKITYR